MFFVVGFLLSINPNGQENLELTLFWVIIQITKQFLPVERQISDMGRVTKFFGGML